MPSNLGQYLAEVIFHVREALAHRPVKAQELSSEPKHLQVYLRHKINAESITHVSVRPQELSGLLLLVQSMQIPVVRAQL